MPQDSIRDTNPNTFPSHATDKQSGTAASSPADELGRAKDALVEGAQHLTEELKSAAGDAADQAKRAAESKLDAGRDFAAEHLGSVADALRRTGDELGKSDSPLSGYVGQAASAVDGVSTYLQTRTLSQLIGDMEGFARREPAMFLGGSFLAGLLGGRFLKSGVSATGTAGASRREESPAKLSPRAPMHALPAYSNARPAGRVSPTPWQAMDRGTLNATPADSTNPQKPIPAASPKGVATSTDDVEPPKASPSLKTTSMGLGGGSPPVSNEAARSTLTGKTNGARNGADRTSSPGTPGTR